MSLTFGAFALAVTFAGCAGGVRAGPADGLHGRLELQVDQSHAALPVVVSWSSLTLSAPAASGRCLVSSEWEPAAGRLTLQLDPGAGCLISITTA